jgi:hypothetical protein
MDRNDLLGQPQILNNPFLPFEGLGCSSVVEPLTYM